MDASQPILFYDIASGPPVRTFAPNPWKTRYALNFKRANYETKWVEFPDVESTRKQLGAPPCRTFADGSPFYTLPVIKNTATGEIVGDSFDIALYLDKIYPESPPLFPPSIFGVRDFNAQVDAIFSNHVRLAADSFPFNPANAEESKMIFARRGGLDSWEQVYYPEEERPAALAAFQAELGDLAKWYKHSDGPFRKGDTPCYADIIIGGWLGFVKATFKPEEWEAIQTWHDGLWGKLSQALEKYATIK